MLSLFFYKIIIINNCNCDTIHELIEINKVHILKLNDQVNFFLRTIISNLKREEYLKEVQGSNEDNFIKKRLPSSVFHE